MSIFRLIQLLFVILFSYFMHKKGMRRLRTGKLHLEANSAVLAAYRKGDYDEALRAADKLKDARDSDSAASYFFYRGTMLMQLGHLQEAEQYLRRNLTVATDEQRRALAYSSLGQLLLEMGRLDDAVECFHTSLQHWPNRGSAHRDLAEACLRRGGRGSDAVRWARLAVQEDRARMNPRDTDALRELCAINLAEDLATLAWAVAADSRDRAEVDRLVDEAARLSVTAVSPAALVHWHCGQAYLALGDYRKSDQHFSEASRIDPKGQWGRSARAMAAGVSK